MDKKYNFYKIFIVFLMSCFSLHIFVLDLSIKYVNPTSVVNSVHKFYLLLWVSMDEFDVIWVVLLIFIYYFLYNNYFIDNKWTKIKTLSCLLSFMISLSIIIGLSLYNYHNLSMITNSFVQVFKCTMVGIGYYLIIYAILKNIFTKISTIWLEKYEK